LLKSIICPPTRHHNKHTLTQTTTTTTAIDAILPVNVFKMADPMDIEIKGAIIEMKEALDKQDTIKLKTLLKNVKEDGRSHEVIDFLVPLLFHQTGSEEDSLSGEEALSLVACLVSAEPSTYLKPVSRTVKLEAARLATSEKPMAVSAELLAVIVSQLSGTDVEVSTNANEALLSCCRKLGPSLSDPAVQAVTETWKQAWAKMAEDRNVASTICVRCASAMVDMMSLGDGVMDSAKSSGATHLLLQMITYEADPLLQMSALDLIERLAGTLPMHRNRASWLCSEAVVDPLLHMAGGKEEAGDPDPILGGSALRTLSGICRLGQRDASLFALGGKDVLVGFHRALHNFEGTGELDRLALVDAIASFASSSADALEIAMSDPMTRECWLSLSVAQPKLKAVILNSVAMVIDPSPEKDTNGDAVTTANVPSNALAM
jgi:hypothetical protein